MKKKEKIGLALSGGGYRAATYHIGTFKALKKLNLLDKIDVISTNSGGSITGACYALHHDNFEKFEHILVSGVKKSVIGRVLKSPRFFIPVLILLGCIGGSIYLLFTPFAWLNVIIWPAVITLILYAQYEILPISRIIEKIYDTLFFENATLKDFSKDFQLTINSTNLSTGKLFNFSAYNMGDSDYSYRGDLEPIHFKPDHFPVSRAVMASSCVPFAFSPVKIAKEFFKTPQQFSEVKPRLVDGGVYDNQGIHKLTFPKSAYFCKQVIISDAGTELPFKESYRNMLTLLIRTSDVFMSRIKNFQMMKNLYRVPTQQDANVAYQSLGFDLTSSMVEFMSMLKNGYLSDDVIQGHNIPAELISGKKWKAIQDLVSANVNIDELIQNGCTTAELKMARSVSTNLVPFPKAQAKALIKHAEAITEIQVKVYLPHLLNS